MRRLLPVLSLIVLCLPVWMLEVAGGGSFPAQRMRLQDDASVVLAYRHSVEQTWVEETYAADSGGLRLTRMRWQSFSAGLPGEYDYHAEGFYVRDLDIFVGHTLDYWFLPLNRAEVSVDGVVVFRGPESPSHVVVRVRRLPVAVALADWLHARLLN